MKGNFKTENIDLREAIQKGIGKMAPEEKARLIESLEAIEPKFNEEEYLNERQKDMMDRFKKLQEEIEELEAEDDRHNPKA